MKFSIRWLAPVFTGLLLSGAATALTTETTNPAPRLLEPQQSHADVLRWTQHVLSSLHYRNAPLDDALSSQVLDRYLESLDAERWFFLASDMGEFESLRHRLDDAIREHDASPAFRIYNVYLQRVAERVRHARSLLEGGFNFEVDENYPFDREDAPWAESNEALNELWRLRVKNDWLRLRLAGKEESEIRELLDQRYHNYVRRIEELGVEDVFQTFVNSWLGAIEPHTAYMGPRASENFQIAMRLSLEGIGAVLQRDNEHTMVRSVVPGGPAGMQGVLKEGDRIVAVGQGETGPMIDVVGWRLDDVVDLIRGPRDTTVRLDILPADLGVDGNPIHLAIVRQRVKLEEQAAQRSILEIGEGDQARRLGVIRLPTFYLDFDARRRGDPDYRSSTRDMQRLLEELKQEGVDGVVVDLRNNGGGSLIEATELTGLFIESGPVVQVQDSRSVKVERDPNPDLAYDGPLLVLVNRNSASASEIFAAAMQDYGRGLIVGEPTYGKGTVQNLIDLGMMAPRERAPLGQLRLTVAQFFRIDGGSTQHRGVVPDVSFPMIGSADEYGESALDNALPWSQIRPAGFNAAGDLSGLVPALNQRHRERIAENTEFRQFQEDIEEIERNRAITSLSLLESTRIRERDEQEARRQSRIAERDALAALPIDINDDGLDPEERTDAAASDQAERPDFLLQEAAAILADLIAVSREESDRALATTLSRPPRGAGEDEDVN